MSAQWFNITAVKKGKAWSDSYGEHQNYALALKGIGEPVRLSLAEPVVKEPKVGDRIHGRLSEEKGPDSRIYYSLKLEAVPADYARQQDIHAQVALKLAVEVWQAQGSDPASYNNIKTEAIHFAKLIEEIKEEL
jgi:hypothetical protein